MRLALGLWFDQIFRQHFENKIKAVPKRNIEYGSETGLPEIKKKEPAKSWEAKTNINSNIEQIKKLFLFMLAPPYCVKTSDLRFTISKERAWATKFFKQKIMLLLQMVKLLVFVEASVL